MKRYLLSLLCVANLGLAQSLPTTTNYMTMDGPWKQTNNAPASGIGVSLNTTTRFLEFPAPASSALFVRNVDGTAVKNVPATLTGKKMRFIARGTNGAKIRVSFKTGSFANVYSTPFLTDGQTHVFTAPSERYIVAEAYSGTVSESTIRGYLYEDFAPELSYGAALGKVGEALSLTPSLNDRGYTVTNCSATSPLPAGLSIKSATCEISGTPSEVLEPTNFTVQVENSQGSSVAAVSIEVEANSPVLSFEGSTGTNGSVGKPMSIVPTQVQTRGAQVTACSVSPVLPSGLTIDPTTCVISGTPTASIALSAFTVSATNSAGTGTAPVSLRIDPEYGTYEKPFSRESAWNIRPVNPQFATNVIPTDSYVPAIGGGAWSTGFFLASETDGPMTIYPRNNNAGVWDPAAETWLPTITLPHWPSSVEAATGSDGHADIYDPTTGLIHSFWILKWNDTLLRWEAQQWSATPITGTGWGTPAKYMAGARAAGVPTGGGLIRKHEINDGKEIYEHVLAMSMTFSGLSANPAYVYPATSKDSDAAWVNKGVFPEGALMMLPPTFDENTLSRPYMKKIARTLKTYGARVVDRNTGTPYYIYVENGSNWPGHKDPVTGQYMWDNVYVNDLQKIRAALRMVTSAESWTDRMGNPVEYNSDGRGVNLLALRKPWKLTSGTVLGIYESSSEMLTWGPTTTASVQVNTDGTGYNRVAWGKITAGTQYKATVVATGGASVNLEFRGSNYSLLYQTGQLKDGQSATFTAPSTYITLTAKSGANVSSSAVKVILEKL
jgi:hypothetical protein